MSSYLRDSDEEDLKEDPRLQKRNQNVNESGFPIVKQLCCSIKGRRFEFVVQSFTDKLMVMITERGRIGQMVSASVTRSRLTGKVHCNVRTLLGVVDDFSLQNLLSRQMIQEISKTSNKTLILGFGFNKDITNDFAPLILKCVEQIKLW